ncbi:hypothetical protein [Pseudomonas aeruginosa]|uniref:hypothetical protein n=1 Tax=Pseudomonas aeruginosa TaxID=287 RepID=UPI000F83BEE6|nr:hypothetical protein [Pseudomonas aeruginosa]RTT49476.1 hypothetical protein DY958_12450 [Pseudomonas aeruginosa]
MMPPAELVLSGIVRPTKEMLAGIGDVAIHPGSGRTPYIDATIFDGITWRALDLKGFGFSLDNRGFGHSSEIGPIMRQIERKIAGHKGSPVYYGYPVNSKRRKYIYRGIP